MDGCWDGTTEVVVVLAAGAIAGGRIAAGMAMEEIDWVGNWVDGCFSAGATVDEILVAGAAIN